MPLLQIRDLTHYFGGLRAVYDYNLDLEEGELVGLIGPNGAGKTTIFNLVTGAYKPTDGEVRLNGDNLVGLRPHQITAKGIGRTFQTIRLWNELTVLDNVRIAHASRIKYGLLSSILRSGQYREEEKQIKEQAMELLAVFGLEGYAQELAKNLPYGAQRRVEIARALATEPRVLLLDEPAAGMNLGEIGALLELIQQIRQDFGLTIWIIERRGYPSGDPEQPQGDRGVSGRGGVLMLLEVKDLRVSYGNIEALHGISFSVDEGEIVTLIGANGAGKTTTLMTISRQIPHVAELGGKVTGGSIMYQDEDLLEYEPHQVVGKFGISQVPEGRRIFGNLSVLENLRLATYARKDRAQIEKDFKRVFEIFPRLEERKHQRGETLSGGEQQMLAVGRALMTRGRLMLLDEPSMGLAPVLVRDIFDTIKEINAQGTTILLVEQNANMALKLAGRGYVIETGNIVLEGTSAELAANPEVKKAYLGG
jgi:branched-chain amino acid transport system ATP-binding protein